MSNVKSFLRHSRNRAKCLPGRISSALGLQTHRGASVQFIIEDAAWAIRTVGENIRDEINLLHPNTVEVATSPVGITNRVVHFGSQYMWLNWGAAAGPSNRYVVSFFHGKHEDGPDVSRHIDAFLKTADKLSKIVASNSLVHDRLLSWGVPHDNIVRIPIGVDTSTFTPPNEQQKLAARSKLKIPQDALVVGSFQKDGMGWGDGMEAKLIKGPDIFVETVRMLAKDLPIFVLLTGPARGYVKSKLDEYGIPFAHTYPEHHADLVNCYHALDFYLMSSREEGGPMGVMESMSSHVPVISTPVGMAPDLIEDGVSGGISKTVDPKDLADKVREIMSAQTDMTLLKSRALEAVQVCDWSVVGRRHYEEVYQPLLQQ